MMDIELMEVIPSLPIEFFPLALGVIFGGILAVIASVSFDWGV